MTRPSTQEARACARRGYGRTTAALLIAFIAAGCAVRRLPDVPVMAAARYALAETRDRICVAVDPFLQEDRLNTYFGANLLSSGIAPLLVVIENRTRHAVLIERQNISAFSARGNALAQIDASSARAPFAARRGTKDAASMALTTLTPWMPPLILAFPFLTKTDYDLDAVLRNVSRKALLDRSVPPGGTHHGFVYFKVEAADIATAVAELRVAVSSLSTEETTAFAFRIHGQREGAEK